MHKAPVFLKKCHWINSHQACARTRIHQLRFIPRICTLEIHSLH
jgi:hypothetical protein